MIPIWLGKIAAKQIIKAVKHKIDLKKIDKYVNKPNELDLTIKELKKDIVILKKDSHAPQEFICCRKCGCKINKTKSKKRR